MDVEGDRQMQLTKFRVTNYRNIHDSGWVRATDITAFVGQNECGKSNLLTALYRLNPFDETEGYSVDRDWPIDLWAGRDDDEVACTAEFVLSDDDLIELEVQLLGDQEDPVGDDSETAPAPEPLKSLSRPVVVTVAKNHANDSWVEFPTGLQEEDNESAERWVLDHLPKCVYMDDYATFSGHTDLTALAAARSNPSDAEKTILIVLDLAAIDLDDLIEKGGSDPGRSVRAFDTSSASKHLTDQFEHMWRQKAVKFNLRTDGPTFDVLAEDEGLGAFVPLEARSRGFQWFVSFVWRFTHASKGEFADCILLLDEPGIHLHHAGHADLLQFFEALAETNSVLYTTHLSTLLDTGYPERVRIMEVEDHHATVRNAMTSAQREPMMVIEQTLGLRPAMSGLLGGRRNLVVEGSTDAIIISKLSRTLLNSGADGLDDSIFLLPSEGAPKTPMYAGFMVGNKLEAAVLLDSDEAGDVAEQKIKELYLSELADEDAPPLQILRLGRCVNTKQNAFAIEDLFPVEWVLECVNDAYNTNLSEDALPTDGSDLVVKRIEVLLKARGRIAEDASISKAAMLAEMQKRFESIHEVKDLPKGTAALAKKLVTKINSAFDLSGQE